jgi:hypothetical protein
MNPADLAAADEVVNELEERLAKLRDRKDPGFHRRRQPDGSEAVMFHVDKTAITWWSGKLMVSYDKRRVLNMTGRMVDYVELDGLNRALAIVRQRQVLDDMAQI